ncbi:MltR family transcriptional regulator [Vibrio albus]|jgi:mannitol operon repressor|uniref:MltR family transcriptional regulator n=1 Tax=Vibrio albus TaxID=2200953 RepID=A0A2U3B8Z6_9VIBR|nr:MltR family transcriptional regulator [Vibrio albus]PWI33253.1 MltR family transcriptional regulator [Vibrio albus]
MTAAFNETDIIERLNSTPSVRGFFITAVEILEEAIDALMQRIFRKDNFAVQSVVGPLLHDSGPLGNLPVRLKLLYGLGVIPDDVYHDMEDIIKLRNELNNDVQEYQFTDPLILSSIKELRLLKSMSMAQLDVTTPDENMDSEFYQLQLLRQQRIIKSSLSLSIIEMCNALNKESPF